MAPRTCAACHGNRRRQNLGTLFSGMIFPCRVTPEL